MKVLVSGATGFTGSHVVPLLLKQGIEVRCFVRTSSDTRLLPQDSIEIVTGDLRHGDSLVGGLRGVDALVNVASLGFGFAPGIIAALSEAGVQRAIFVSTTAVYTRLSARSKTVRIEAENAIQGSGVEFTILRPTMIYGGSRDRNMCRLIRFLSQHSVVPIPGSGRGLQQPVYVGDVAAAICQCLMEEVALNKIYNIPGASILTLSQVIDTICALLQRKVRKIHLPAKPIAKALGIAERLSIRLPIRSEQVLRLKEDKIFDYSEARRDLGYRPRSFADGIRMELRDMGLI